MVQISPMPSLHSSTGVNVGLVLFLHSVTLINIFLGQLQKMGILDPAKQSKPTGISTKRRSAQLDFSNLPPLKSGGTVGFSAFRDNEFTSKKNKLRKRSNGGVGDVMAEDSEEDDDDVEIVGKMDEIDDKDVKTMLSPEDARHQGELAEGVGRIKVRFVFFPCL
jgi:hypothetical protein